MCAAWSELPLRLFSRLACLGPGSQVRPRVAVGYLELQLELTLALPLLQAYLRAPRPHASAPASAAERSVVETPRLPAAHANASANANSTHGGPGRFVITTMYCTREVLVPEPAVAPA